jgi:CRISPR-associated protein Cas1
MTKRCELARRFVMGKLSNQRQRLQRYNRTRQDTEVSRAIKQLTDQLSSLGTLSAHQPPGMKPLTTGDHRIEGTALETILGMEGAGSAAHFRCFGKLLSTPKQWPFGGTCEASPYRSGELLGSRFGYSLLANKVASAVQLVGFDHFVGYLHSSFYGKPSLALDLLEEFRPLIVDSVVVDILNHRMLTPADFIGELGAYRLKQEKRTVFFTKLEERLNEEIQHPIFGYKTSYRRRLELQARLLAKVLTGEIDEYPPLLERREKR